MVATSRSTIHNAASSAGQVRPKKRKLNDSLEPPTRHELTAGAGRVTRRSSAAAAGNDAALKGYMVSRSVNDVPEEPPVAGLPFSGLDRDRQQAEILVTPTGTAQTSTTPVDHHFSPSDIPHSALPTASTSLRRIPEPAPDSGLIQVSNTSSAPLAAPPPVRQTEPFPYPIGMTPFRYPCLHPGHPPPAPGDPLSSKWKPFDPNHVSHLQPLPAAVRALSLLGQAMDMPQGHLGQPPVRGQGDERPLTRQRGGNSSLEGPRPDIVPVGASRRTADQTVAVASASLSPTHHPPESRHGDPQQSARPAGPGPVTRQTRKKAKPSPLSSSATTRRAGLVPEQKHHLAPAPPLIPLDPALNFAHLPLAARTGGPGSDATNLLPGSTISHASAPAPDQPVPNGINGLANPVGHFDINSFLDSATYETISALLAAGDPAT